MSVNKLLWGFNEDERIVAVQQKDDRTMRIYFREASGIRHTDDKFYPFIFLAETGYLDGFTTSRWLKKLDGTAYYQYICAFEDWPTMWEAIRHIMLRYNKDALTKVENYADLNFLFLYTDPVTQYLIQTGRTLFKGMTFDEVYRLQLDIETYTAGPHRFSKASRREDQIILIALSDNRGWHHLIDGKKMNEREMLTDLVRIIREKDPDVIEGHNIYNFDFPYILKRCELNNLTLAIGRDGSVPRSFNTYTSFAERSSEYAVTEIAGRHIIDTLILVQNYDVSKRDMESYGLKYAAKYFGFATDDRTYIKGDRISWHWDNDVRPLMDYALDDVTETRNLSDQLLVTYFYLAQMLPFNFGPVTRTGSATKIESLIVREYLRERYSIPKPEEGLQTSGGYTDIFSVGILGPVMHVDVESLYPSIMLSKSITPASDVKNVFTSLLKDLTALRLDSKRKMKAEKNPQLKSQLDAIQSSLKILINSFYGYLGYSRGLFNDYAQADEVTRTGQALLQHMIKCIKDAGGKVIEVDTDGAFFVPPTHVRDETGELSFVEELSRLMPEGISVALDGRYSKMVSYRKKNYALLGYDNRIKIRGSSLTSRSMERFARHYITQCIDCLLNSNTQGLHTLYVQLSHSIADHKIDVKDFARVETLKDSLADYIRDVETGKRNRSAAYEVAIASGKPLRPGDRVAYYITGSDRTPRSFDNCKPAEEWDPNFPDENTTYYLRRLDEFSEKFKPFFLPQDFRSIFSADDLFPFSPVGITPLVTDVSGTEPTESVDLTPSELGIWIEE